MIGHRTRRPARPARKQQAKYGNWLGAEIELIIRERERLLQAAGAAAALFTKLDIKDVPREAREPIRKLGAVLATLSEETLTDAIEGVLGRGLVRTGSAG